VVNIGLATNALPKGFRGGFCGLVREYEYLGPPRELGVFLAGAGNATGARRSGKVSRAGRCDGGTARAPAATSDEVSQIRWTASAGRVTRGAGERGDRGQLMDLAPDPTPPRGFG
jgi:hypothetical protein